MNHKIPKYGSNTNEESLVDLDGSYSAWFWLNRNDSSVGGYTGTSGNVRCTSDIFPRFSSPLNIVHTGAHARSGQLVIHVRTAVFFLHSL